MAPKAQLIKGKTDKFDIKFIFISKVKWMKNKLQGRRKYFKTTYMTKDVYLD